MQQVDSPARARPAARAGRRSRAPLGPGPALGSWAADPACLAGVRTMEEVRAPLGTLAAPACLSALVLPAESREAPGAPLAQRSLGGGSWALRSRGLGLYTGFCLLTVALGNCVCALSPQFPLLKQDYPKKLFTGLEAGACDTELMGCGAPCQESPFPS